MNKKSLAQGKVSLTVVLIISLLVTLSGFTQFLVNKAHGAALTNIQAILSTSAPAASSSLTVEFVTPTGISGAKDLTLTIQLDTGGSSLFSLPSGYNVNSIDVATSTDTTCSASASFTDVALSGSATTTSQWAASINTATDVITLTYPGGGTTNATVPAGTCLQVQIGSVATASTTGVDFNTPTKVLGAGTADVYTIAMGGTVTDSGNGMVAIIEGVTVSATVTQTLSFSMTGVTTGSCTGDSGSPTFVNTSGSSTTIPFGALSGANTFYVGCHRLSVSTNAANGFSTTIEENKPLKTTASSTIPDTTCDAGACSESATSTWATNTNNGFGYSCENIGGNGLCSNGSGSLGSVTTGYRNIACTGGTGFDLCNAALDTKQIFMSTTTSVSAQDVKIHYKLSVSGIQAAGSYSNTVTYIATPSF